MFRKIDEWDGVEVYACLSSDTKQTGVQKGSYCIETDTQNLYRLYGSWTQIESGGSQIVHTGVFPTNYSPDNIDLTQAGQGIAIASGAIKVWVTIKAVLAGPLLYAFGTTELDAEGNVDGTVDSEVGFLVNLPVTAAHGTGSTGVGLSALIDIPVAFRKTSATTPYIAFAEGHGTPTGKILVGQGA